MDLDHYSRKVGEMRVKREQNKVRGKPESTREEERFNRNEAKLSDAQIEYDVWCEGVVDAITQSVDNGWQDMVPLLKFLLQFENHYFKRLVDTRDDIAAVAQRMPGFEQGDILSLQERLSKLKDLEDNPELAKEQRRREKLEKDAQARR